MEWNSFSVHSYLWEPLSGLQLTAGSLGTAQLKGLSGGSGALGIGAVVALRPITLHSHLHVPSLWKEKGVGSLCSFFSLFFFFFLPKVYFQCLSCGSHPQAQFIVTVH